VPVLFLFHTAPFPDNQHCANARHRGSAIVCIIAVTGEA
jgi:hypothetical protein